MEEQLSFLKEQRKDQSQEMTLLKDITHSYRWKQQEMLDELDRSKEELQMKELMINEKENLVNQQAWKLKKKVEATEDDVKFLSEYIH